MLWTFLKENLIVDNFLGIVLGKHFMDLDLFISFSSSDRDKLFPVINELEKSGLSVWWSDYLEEGRWDIQIEEKIDSADRVLAFISPNVGQSSRDYIFEELERARSQNKLIPVIVGGGSQSFAIRGIVALLQSYFFDSFDEIIELEEFDKLLNICGRGKNRDKDLLKNRNTSTPNERVENWFDKIEKDFDQTAQLYLFSLSLATAIFEYASFTEVESLAQNLFNSLQYHEEGEEVKSLAESNCPSRRSPLLKVLECEINSVEHSHLGVDQTIIHFKDPERAAAYLQFSWEEFGNRRQVLHKWLTDLAAIASAEARLRLGFALGTLAQKNYIDVFEQVLKDWLLSNKQSHQLTADIALSVAAFNPKIPSALRKNIILWAKSDIEDQVEASIRLACGFSGTRVPDLTIEILKIVSNDKAKKLTISIIDTMETSLRNLLATHLEDTDNSLFDFPSLVETLATWAVDDISLKDNERTIRENPYPLLIFLLILENIPLEEKLKTKGSLSLSTLVHSSKLAKLTAIVFNSALKRPRINSIHTRKPAEQILRNWVSDYSTRKKDNIFSQSDSLFLLAKKLITTAFSSNDRDRVLYIFSPIFSEEKLLTP